jgi:hypothetical protein
MPNKPTEMLEKLQQPFDPFDIEWRPQSAGKTKEGKLWAIVVPYVDNRAIQDRLDEVCGPDGWYNKFEYPTEKAVNCGISIKFQEEGWITKWDGAQETNIEAVKGGLSNAMKRAAVQWGIGRYLYKLEAVIVTPVDKKPYPMGDHLMAVVKLEGKQSRIYYKRPSLPKWALPEEKADDGQAD